MDATLRVVGRDDVFAAGDATAFDPGVLLYSGVHAVRAGPVLAANLRAAATLPSAIRTRPAWSRPASTMQWGRAIA